MRRIINHKGSKKIFENRYYMSCKFVSLYNDYFAVIEIGHPVAINNIKKHLGIIRHYENSGFKYGYIKIK